MRSNCPTVHKNLWSCYRQFINNHEKIYFIQIVVSIPSFRQLIANFLSISLTFLCKLQWDSFFSPAFLFIVIFRFFIYPTSAYFAVQEYHLSYFSRFLFYLINFLFPEANFVGLILMMISDMLSIVCNFWTKLKVWYVLIVFQSLNWYFWKFVENYSLNLLSPAFYSS